MSMTTAAPRAVAIMAFRGCTHADIATTRHGDQPTSVAKLNKYLSLMSCDSNGLKRPDAIALLKRQSGIAGA